MKDLLGGEERIDEKSATWGDSFIVNLGTEAHAQQVQSLHPKNLDNWHVDGDFFVRSNRLYYGDFSILIQSYHSRRSTS